MSLQLVTAGRDQDHQQNHDPYSRESRREFSRPILDRIGRRAVLHWQFSSRLRVMNPLHLPADRRAFADWGARIVRTVRVFRIAHTPRLAPGIFR